jgi:hypothetical protein
MSVMTFPALEQSLSETSSASNDPATVTTLFFSSYEIILMFSLSD